MTAGLPPGLTPIAPQAQGSGLPAGLTPIPSGRLPAGLHPVSDAQPKPNAIPRKTYNAQELAQLWTSQGGDPTVAELMGHVAYEESAGVPDNTGHPYTENGKTYRAHGLWQISDVHGNQDWNDPITNVRQAIALYNANQMQPWESSRTSGATGGWGKYAGAAFAHTVPHDHLQKLGERVPSGLTPLESPTPQTNMPAGLTPIASGAPKPSASVPPPPAAGAERFATGTPNPTAGPKPQSTANIVFNSVNEAMAEGWARAMMNAMDPLKAAANLEQTPARFVHTLVQHGVSKEQLGMAFYNAFNPGNNDDDTKAVVGRILAPIRELDGPLFPQRQHEIISKGGLTEPAADANAADVRFRNFVETYVAQSFADPVSYLPFVQWLGRVTGATRAVGTVADAAKAVTAESAARVADTAAVKALAATKPGQAAARSAKALQRVYGKILAAPVKVLGTRPELNEFLDGPSKAARLGFEGRYEREIEEELGHPDQKLLEQTKPQLESLDKVLGTKHLGQDITQAGGSGTRTSARLPLHPQSATPPKTAGVADVEREQPTGLNAALVRQEAERKAAHEAQSGGTSELSYARPGVKSGRAPVSGRVHSYKDVPENEPDYAGTSRMIESARRPKQAAKNVTPDTERLAESYTNPWGDYKTVGPKWYDYMRLEIQNLPKEIQQRILSGPFHYGDMDMRTRAMTLGYEPSEADMLTTPQGVMRPNDYKRLTTMEHEPDTPLPERLDARLNAERQRIARRKISAATEDFLKTHGGWKGDEPMDVGKLSFGPKTFNSPLAVLGRWGTQAVQGVPFPHALNNVGTLTYIAGGPEAIGYSTAYMARGVAKTFAEGGAINEQRIKDMGAFAEYTQDPGTIWSKIPVSHQALQLGQATLSHMEIAYRAGLLRQLDRTMGPSIDAEGRVTNLPLEMMKGQKIRDAVIDYRNVPLVIAWMQAGGAPFAPFFGGLVNAVGQAILKHPNRIADVMRVEGDAQQNLGVTIPNPVDTFNQLLFNAPHEIASRAGLLGTPFTGKAGMLKPPNLEELGANVLRSTGGPWLSRLPAFFNEPYPAPGTGPLDFTPYEGTLSTLTGGYPYTEPSGYEEKKIQKAEDKQVYDIFATP